MKKFWLNFIAPLYLTSRFFVVISFCAILFIVSFFLQRFNIIPYLALIGLVLAVIVDYVVLFFNRQGFAATRSHADRLSNGDENPITLHLQNRYTIGVTALIVDEVPFQFQRRDLLFKVPMMAGGQQVLTYQLRPVKRGVYHFGIINIYIQSSIGMVNRRYKFRQSTEVPVYPSYIQMRKYQLMAISNRLSEVGVKKIRRLGHSMEFEQIKEYVQGDDYRTLNWKASARKGQLMVNTFTDEKSQQVYCVIDKGRVMKMPFDGLSLLDYAINASLVVSNVALLKQDKAGIITFGEQIGTFLPANKKPTQMQAILEVLYNQKTRYLESDYEQLYIQIKRNISQRSLIMLYTNFESLGGMQRQLPYLRQIAKNHLLMVVFFENTALKNIIQQPALQLEDVYTKTVAEKFAFEKRLIVNELQQHGIVSVLTTPQQLAINAINKYLELKARQAI